MATISRRNIHNVPESKWKEWTPRQRQAFNLVYSTMRANQKLYLHPDAVPHSRKHWHTTAWNAAWTAAGAAEGEHAGEDGPMPTRAERAALAAQGITVARIRTP